MAADLAAQKELIVGLLRASPEPVPISDIWRGLQNRDVEVGYTELEDWLLDQTGLIQVAVTGGVTLMPGIDAGRVRPIRVVPDRYEIGTDTDAATRWHRLIAYYKNCLLEEGKAIAAYREQEGSSFILLSEELNANARSFASVRTADAPNFIRNTADGSRPSYYGYPLMLEWIETGDGEFADYKVIPVFIARLEVQQEPSHCRYLLDTKTIRLNPLITSRTKWRDRDFVRSRLDADADSYDSFDERLEMIAAVLPDVKTWEELDPASIVRAKSLEGVEPKKPGLYNRCGIFLGGSNPYIQGLIRDLDQMATKSQGHFDRTALAPLLRTKTLNFERPLDTKSNIRVLNPGDKESLLNAPQEQAVAQTFVNQLSVITGPPGTGKSQVVTSIIASAVLHDKTVLFASRNNKALEVVQERIKKACPAAHALVRVGGNYDEECRDLLQRMGNLPPRTDVMSFSRQMQSIDLHLSELDKLNAALDEAAELLSRASIAKDRFDVLKKKFLPGNPKAYESVKEFSVDSLLALAKRFESLMKRVAGKPRTLGKLMIRLQANKGKKEIELLSAALNRAGIEFNAQWPATPDDLRSEFRNLFPLVDLVQSVTDMTKAADELGAAAKLEKLFERIYAEKISIAKKVGPLLLAKVKENASGAEMSQATDEAIQRYRSTMPQLKGKKLNDEQRRIRLEELGRVFPDMLCRLPAWAVTNLSVSHRIPLEPAIFDLLVIDEASQCDIPSCLPLLYRAKQAVIIGDPLQLPQITNITKNVEDKLLQKQCLDGPENDHLRYSEKSMYDAAQWVVPRSASQFLSSHYRCHPDIIRFANTAHWYEDRLEVFTDEEKLKRPKFWKRGIEWIQVTSRSCQTGKMYLLPEEVARTVEAVRTLLQDQKYEGTVGVVCPLRDMVDRIRDGVQTSVDGIALAHAKFEANTAHGFQGDERDIIIYAMAVHPDMPRGARWFIAENKNLFNVALSRARAAFIVVGDKESVRQFAHEDKPVVYLREFVDYVDSLQGKVSMVEGEPLFAPEQLWEEEFYRRALKPAGFPIYSQYPLGPYKLDFALLRKDRIRKLDIEIDGESHHKDNAGKRLRRDIDRDIYVKAQDRGSWDVMRFWVYELREDMESCLNRIHQWMNSAP